MKILSAQQLKKADKVTLQKQQISSEELMERAATLAFKEIHQRLKAENSFIKIFCGTGNNGGDGLVIGRLLLEKGYEVKIYIINYSKKRSEDFLSNYEKIKKIGREPILINGEKEFPEIYIQDVVIDAIFGIGLSRPLIKWVANLVKHINKAKPLIFAIDMPSGLFAEKLPEKSDAVIKATTTITFQSPKLIFFLPAAAKYVGNIQVIDIGLDRDFLDQTSDKAKLINKQEALEFYKPRESFAHKGNYGHCLIVGGSYGKIGSMVLAATSALRTGAGLCSVFIPKCGYEIFQTALPEAMVITDKNNEMLTSIEYRLDPRVICFGMGAGVDGETKKAFEKLLRSTKNPMIIDADGLNLLAKQKNLLKLIPVNSVLTPHPKELERLIGDWNDDFDKLEKVQAFVMEYSVILVLKGAHTMIFGKGNLYINTTGNPGMATAGSGDVLSGVITGLMSQNYDPIIAAVFGVYLHGRSGDITASQLGYEGMIAGDIAKNMGLAFLDLFEK